MACAMALANVGCNEPLSLVTAIKLKIRIK